MLNIIVSYSLLQTTHSFHDLLWNLTLIHRPAPKPVSAYSTVRCLPPRLFLRSLYRCLLSGNGYCHLLCLSVFLSVRLGHISGHCWWLPVQCGKYSAPAIL